MFVVVIIAILGCVAVCCLGRVSMQKQQDEEEKARGEMRHLVESHVDDTA